MNKLIERYEEIKNLIDSHGDVFECEQKNCAKCSRITELRSIISPPEKRGRKTGASHGKRSVYRIDYYVTGNGEEHLFKTQKQVRGFLKTSYPILRDMIDNKRVFKGYTLELKNREERSNEL